MHGCVLDEDAQKRMGEHWKSNFTETFETLRMSVPEQYLDQQKVKMGTLAQAGVLLKWVLDIQGTDSH